MDEDRSRRITERLTGIIESYRGVEEYSNLNLRLGEMIKLPRKQVWMATYEIPENNSSKAIVLEYMEEGYFFVVGKYLTWIEREPKIRLEDQESAFKEFEQRVKEIPSDIENIFV